MKTRRYYRISEGCSHEHKTLLAARRCFKRYRAGYQRWWGRLTAVKIYRVDVNVTMLEAMR